MNERHDDLQEIIDAALREMAAEEGDGFDPQACNLAEFCRRTGLTRSRARTVRAHGFRAGTVKILSQIDRGGLGPALL